MNKDCEVCGKSLGDVVFHRKYCIECHDKRPKAIGSLNIGSEKKREQMQ